MTAPILVTGGTGTIGARVVPRLLAAGRTVRVLTRHGRPDGDPAAPGVDYRTGDLDSGAGVEAALDGVEVVVHCAGSRSGDEAKAANLAGPAARAGIAHLVNVSVAGADRVPAERGLDRMLFGYFGAKLAAERAVAASGVPWTTLRLTQVHDLLFLVAEQLGRLPVVPVPAGIGFQPVDAGEAADRLAELALGAPAGLVAELGGPRAYGMDELVASYLAAAGRANRPLLRLPLPGRAALALRAGANLAPDGAVGRRTWEEYLAERLGAPALR
jgi:uncharacterized protein YbjT (DUF2867 family)